MSYEDKVLLRLKRKYDRDEVIKLLQDELYKAQFKNGELISELEELKATLKKGKREFKEKLIDEKIEELRKGLATTRAKNTLLKKQVIEWRNKYFDILATTRNTD
jgi:hypothetical protein